LRQMTVFAAVPGAFSDAGFDSRTHRLHGGVREVPCLPLQNGVLQTLALGFSLSEIRLRGCKTYNFISSF
jgi:hypothetical protein